MTVNLVPYAPAPVILDKEVAHQDAKATQIAHGDFPVTTILILEITLLFIGSAGQILAMESVIKTIVTLIMIALPATPALGMNAVQALFHASTISTVLLVITAT